MAVIAIVENVLLLYFLPSTTPPIAILLWLYFSTEKGYTERERVFMFIRIYQWKNANNAISSPARAFIFPRDQTDPHTTQPPSATKQAGRLALEDVEEGE